MRKFFVCLMLCIAIGATAREKRDDSKYLAGAVPEVNGLVTFKKSFTVPGKSPQEIREVVKTLIGGMVNNSIPAPGNYARIMEDSEQCFVARVCEWMVFKKKFLNLDRTRFRYQIEVNFEGSRVETTIHQLTYYYSENMEGEQGMLFKAEEWISDKEALNKTQTKLYPKSGKFRRKTVDRMEEIFDNLMDAFEEKEVAPVKPVRKSVVED